MTTKSPSKRVHSNSKRAQNPAPASAKNEQGMPEPVTIEFEGRTDEETGQFEPFTYTVDLGALDDIEVLEALSRTDPMTGKLPGLMVALQKAMGEDYERFKLDQVELHGRCTGTAIGELFEKVDGFAPGN